MVETLAEYAAKLGTPAEFVSEPWYNAAGDCVHYFFDQAESYRDRVDDKLTVYRSLETKEIVGCQIKGIRAMLRKFGSYGIVVTKNEIPLMGLVVLSLWEGEESSYKLVTRKKYYKALAKRTKDMKVRMPVEWDKGFEEAENSEGNVHSMN